MAIKQKITVAKNAGFCFGVKRATDMIEHRAAENDGTRLYIIGELIHNGIYNKGLRDKGIGIIDAEDAERLAVQSDTQGKCEVYIRTHGIPLVSETKLRALEAEHENFKVVDMTCPFVKRIHRIAAENTSEDTLFLLLGSHNHPEAEGIMSYAKGEKAVLYDSKELENFLKNRQNNKKSVVFAAQTTQNLIEFKICKKILEKVYTNPIFFDTICSVTQSRQEEIQVLAKESDAVIVVGGKDSSNTGKLFDLAGSLCENTVWIEDPAELVKDDFKNYSRIGVAAGASTPPGIIEEVVNTMNSEITAENFEQMLEASLKPLNTGDIVKCVVTSISGTELNVDLGAKVTGVIPKSQITDDPNAKLEDLFKIGDEFDAFVIKVSDIEGMATLSKKRVDLINNWNNIVNYYNNGDIVEGKIVEAVKGGVIIIIDGVRVLIPARHTGLPMNADLSTLVGKVEAVKIIDINDSRRHAYASIKAPKLEAKKALEEAFWASIEEGKHYLGKVKSMTSYGAFVDLGGVDGMVHNTELSWKRIKHPSEVVAIGDEIDVWVKEFDVERKRISLGYKTPEMNSWYIFVNKYQIGDVVPVKIVSMMPFGAFAEIIDGTDGLIHISQIANKKISKPADVLELGQVVDAKIIDIDTEKQKVSLSIRALLTEDDSVAADEAEAEAVETADAE
ncbi:MAG: 4-hydroxy-3-methylbut-2-enyl diphosphate reductase [Clostridia bacterium]|nr:4-hydroxy-3-methylbut-2-enyl diphosphate reductase [Clostridia bacterium]